MPPAARTWLQPLASQPGSPHFEMITDEPLPLPGQQAMPAGFPPALTTGTMMLVKHQSAIAFWSFAVDCWRSSSAFAWAIAVFSASCAISVSTFCPW